MAISKRVGVPSTARANLRLKLNRWEREIFEDILRRQRAANAIPFARFNFLVHAGRVFFLDKVGWWHSVPGEARKVAAALRATGIQIVRVKLVRSSALWTPYFGRTRDEELNRGWNDPSIELEPARKAHATALREAWELYRAQAESKHPIAIPVN